MVIIFFSKQRGTQKHSRKALDQNEWDEKVGRKFKISSTVDKRKKNLDFLISITNKEKLIILNHLRSFDQNKSIIILRVFLNFLQVKFMDLFKKKLRGNIWLAYYVRSKN